jgi:hypothetical protein
MLLTHLSTSTECTVPYLPSSVLTTCVSVSTELSGHQEDSRIFVRRQARDSPVLMCREEDKLLKRLACEGLNSLPAVCYYKNHELTSGWSIRGFCNRCTIILTNFRGFCNRCATRLFKPLLSVLRVISSLSGWLTK